MNLVTIILKSSPHVLQFHFDKYSDAERAMNRTNDDRAEISDDYGSKASIIMSEVAGVFLTDLRREMEASEIVELEKHRKDIRIGKKMQSEQNAGLAMPRHLMGSN